MDSSYAINWFDVRFGVQSKGQAEPVEYQADLCAELDPAGANYI